MTGRLGVGRWRFEHRDRVGTIIGETGFGAPGWTAEGNRRVDRYSEGVLTVDDGCCGSLSRATFGHEIWFYRDDSVYPAYIGVVRDRTVDAANVRRTVVRFADRSFLWTGRPVYPYVGAAGELLLSPNIGDTPDVTVVAQAIVDIGDQVVPVGLTLSVPSGVGASGVTATPRVAPRALDTVYDAMVELGDLLVDWTVVGGVVFIDAPELPWSPILFDTRTSWVDGVSITESGDGFATHVSVTGADGAFVSHPAFHDPLIVDPVRGYFWQGVDGGSQDDGQGVLSGIALGEWQRSHNPTVSLAASNVRLDCDLGVEFHDLLPGRRCVVDTHGVCGLPRLVESRVAEVVWEVEDGVDRFIGVDIETLGATK